MKTEKFDDAIRRKLESIEPPFRERDWAHMQAFMHHHGYPPAWVGASQWLMPMAAAAAVTGLLVSAVWQFHTNQQLRQSVQTLSQMVSRLETTQAKLLKLPTRTDTVYVTTFTKTPATAPARSAATTQPAPNESAQRQDEHYALRPVQPAGVATARLHHQPETGAEPTGSTQSASPLPVSTGLARNEPLARPQPSTAPPVSPADSPATTTPRLVVDKDLKDVAAAPTPANTPARMDEQHLAATPAARPNRRPGQTPSPGGTAPVPTVAGEAVANQTYAPAIPSSRRDVNRLTDGAAGQPAGQNEAAQPQTLALLHLRPLRIDSAYYGERIASRTRRIRSLLPPLVAPTPVASLPAQPVPTEVTSSRPASMVRVRLGASAQIGTMQQMAGAYGEVLLGRHWAVGAGLDRVALQGGHFATDEQFDRQTQNDFRQLYAPAIDHRLPIIDINRQFSLWQLPVSLSYRAVLGKGFALVPTVGTTFNISAQETVTFTYLRGPAERKVPAIPQTPACNLFNVYTMAFGAEKSWKHLVLQAGPVLAVPTKITPDQFNPVSLSLRTRVLFQF